MPTRKKLFLVIVAIFVGFLLLDLMTPAAFEFQTPFIPVLMMNLVVAQLTLVCVWGALVEGTFWIRLPWTILMLVISWAGLAYGVYLVHGTANPAEVLALGLIWFYAFMISYIPLKLAAWGFGWRILKVGQKDSSKPKNNYQIRDIMIGTAILAVTLSIGRMVVPGDLPSWEEVLSKSGLSDYGAFISLFVFSVVSLIVKLPCIWITLAVPLSSILRYSTSWIAIAAVLGLFEMGVLIFFLRISGTDPEMWDLAAGLMVGHAVMAASMIGVLYLLRTFGYRMSRRKRLAAD